MAAYILMLGSAIAVAAAGQVSVKQAERPPEDEEKKQEKERRLEISRRKAAEARAAIKPKSVVRFVPKVPPPRPRPPPVEEAA